MASIDSSRQAVDRSPTISPSITIDTLPAMSNPDPNMLHVAIPSLCTARLSLVPPQAFHLPVYEALYRSADVMRHIGEPFDGPTTAKHLAAHAGSWVLFGFGGWCVEGSRAATSSASSD